MKKLFLLVTAGLFCAQLQAQSVKSVVFVDQNGSKSREMNDANVTAMQAKKYAKHSANKTTAAGGSDWFSFGDIMYTSSVSKAYYNPMYNDSSVQFVGSSGNVHIFQHGFGMSFDPTDSVFHGGDNDFKTVMGPIGNINNIANIRVTQNNAYTVDSIRFPFKYLRKDPSSAVVDTMIITVAKISRNNNTGPGVYSFTGQNTGRRSGVVVINPANNKADSVPAGTTVITKLLDAAFAADTTTGTGSGYSNYTLGGIALPSVISLNAGEILVIYVTVRFKSYALHTMESSANIAHFYSYDFAGSSNTPKQCGGSFMSGLSNDNHTIYHAPVSDTDGFHWEGHNITIPSVFYLEDGSFTDIDVKVTCTTCPVLNVANLNISNIASVSSYPNPTTADLTINFNLKEAANTTVSISNAIGQVLATKELGIAKESSASFNTDKLANGIYFYTVDANGQRQTNRFVVSH